MKSSLSIFKISLRFIYPASCFFFFCPVLNGTDYVIQCNWKQNRQTRTQHNKKDESRKIIFQSSTTLQIHLSSKQNKAKGHKNVILLYFFSRWYCWDERRIQQNNSKQGWIGYIYKFWSVNRNKKVSTKLFLFLLCLSDGFRHDEFLHETELNWNKRNNNYP